MALVKCAFLATCPFHLRHAVLLGTMLALANLQLSYCWVLGYLCHLSLLVALICIWVIGTVILRHLFSPCLYLPVWCVRPSSRFCWGVQLCGLAIHTIWKISLHALWLLAVFTCVSGTLISNLQYEASSYLHTLRFRRKK